jgi:hypothetical protein
MAAPEIDKAYIRSLASPGSTVLVIEYFDGGGQVAKRKGYASKTGFKAVSATDFKVDDKTSVHLFGLEPCDGDMVNRKEGYAGSCQDYAQEQLSIMLQSPKVVYCRAFLSEENRPVQDATCYGYYNFPGSLDTIDMLEEQLVSMGALRLAKDQGGKPKRSDLKDAEEIGIRGWGMWVDPRIKAQSR